MPESASPDTPDTPSGSATVVQHGPPHHVLTTPDGALGFAGTDRFRLLEEIAHGGMGIVYRARDLVFDREVGLKTLLKVPTEGSALVSRFREEARITGQLQHPNIPPVHDLGTLPDGRPYLAMKLIKGQTLEAMIGARPDLAHDRGEYLAIFEQIAHGVAYAHAHEVIHRDLKPLNVMVGAFGEVQVMDWGLAKVLTDSPARTARASEIETGPPTDIRPARDESDETRAGSVFGTPAYMPREQAIGAVDQIDARSDVFSLGGILCAILTGKPPYVGADGESTRQLAAVAKLDTAFARLDACGAEPELIELCKRCLSSDRDERPLHAGEVARAVAGLRAEAEQRARRAELDRVRAEGERAKAELQTAEQRKRRKVQLALLGSVLLLVAGGGAFAWWQDKQATKRQIEEERLASEKTERETRNRDAFIASLKRCENALRAGDADTADTALLDVNKRLAEGGTDGFDQRIARCRNELAILKGLDQIDRFRWTTVNGGLPDRSVVAEKWRANLGEFGIVPGTTPASEVSRRLSDTLIRERLLTVLDLWLVFAPSQHLVAILKEVDPDDYRDEVRNGVLHAKRDDLKVAGTPDDPFLKLQQLLNKPEALEQPPRFALAIASCTRISLERQRIVLEQVLTDQPGNAMALLTMIETYYDSIDQKKGAVERLIWCQAAVAAHPRNPTVLQALGNAYLSNANNPDPESSVRNQQAAIGAYRKSLQFDPQNPWVMAELGSLLVTNGQTNSGIELLRRAGTLAPTNYAIHANLGSALKRADDLDGAIAAYNEALKYVDPQRPILRRMLLDDLKDAEDARRAKPSPPAVKPDIEKDSENASIRGKVLFDTGRPIFEGEVVLHPAKGKPLTADIQPDGTFEIKDVPKGQFGVSVEAKGVAKRYSDPKASGLRLEVTLSAHNFTIRVAKE